MEGESTGTCPEVIVTSISRSRQALEGSPSQRKDMSLLVASSLLLAGYVLPPTPVRPAAPAASRSSEPIMKDFPKPSQLENQLRREEQG
jgi:hypothetical protein